MACDGRVVRAYSGDLDTVVAIPLWFTPLREALDGYVNAVQERVSGVVRLELFKGACRVVPGTSPSVARPRAVAEPVGLFEPADPGASPTRDICVPAETISKD